MKAQVTTIGVPSYEACEEFGSRLGTPFSDGPPPFSEVSEYPVSLHKKLEL